MRNHPIYWESLRSSRKLGIHIVAGKGTGKSRFMGRLLSFYDVKHRIPTVIIDPVGQLINNLLDRIERAPVEQQRQIWPRIRYIDMAGRDGYVVPTPFYYRLGDEPLFQIGNRFIDLIERADPNLEIAPVQGMNAVRTVGSPVGVILAALGYQITEAEDLMADIDGWKRKIQSLEPEPDIVKARTFLTRDFTRTQAAMFKNKVSLLTIDPANRAMFGAQDWGIPWKEVLDNDLCLLIDLSAPGDTYIRRIKMTWVFQSFINYIQYMGLKRAKPISLVVDELNEMYRMGDDTFSQEIDRLIHTLARNLDVWMTLAHQEMSQFDELTQKTLMTMGTQVIGKTDDPEAARDYAHRFNPYDENWIHTVTPRMMNQSVEGTSFPVQVGEDIKYHSADEQERLEMPKFMNLSPMEFYIKLADTQRLRGLRLTGEDIRRDVWLDRVELNKGRLMRKYGRRIEDIEREIQERTGTIKYDAPQRIQTRKAISEDDEAFG